MPALNWPMIISFGRQRFFCTPDALVTIAQPFTGYAALQARGGSAGGVGWSRGVR